MAMTVGLGISQFMLWLFYAVSLFNRITAWTWAALSIAAGIIGLVRIARRKLSIPSVSWCEALCLCGVLAFSEGMFECLVGTPPLAWDAAVSWDKWAETIAGRTGIGHSIYGGYPLGIPLLLSLPYKLLVPANEAAALAIEHLLVLGFLQFFPLLLGVATLSAARSLRLNPFWPIVLLLGNNCLLICGIKYSGYVDFPLAAIVAGATALILEFRRVHADIGNAADHGDFSTVRTAALFSAAFAIAFTKGNGCYLLILFALSAVAFERRRLVREEIFGVSAAIGAALVFYLHQWIFGVWVGGAETSPFLHALPVMPSHADIVRRDFNHFKNIVVSLGSFHGATNPIMSVAVTAAISLLLVAALFRRGTRTAAAVSIVGMALWSIAGSYDGRNMIPILPITALLVALMATSIIARLQAASKMPSHAIVVIAMLLASALLPPLRSSRFADIASRTFKPFDDLRGHALPTWVTVSPLERQARLLKIPSDAVPFFTDSGFAGRTAHILSASVAYRALPDKGIYPLQLNAHNEARPHDLAFSSRIYNDLPRAYEQIAQMKSKALGETLYLREPKFTEVIAEIALSNTDATDDVSTWKIILDNPLDSGVVSVRIDGNDIDGARLSQVHPVTPLADILESVAVGNSVRVPFWRGDNAGEKRIVLELSIPQGAVIDGVEMCE